ncbi:Zf-AN1 domain-containing protein [Ceratobasidium theobromae]|uniref:Zf-AN1 domain-containing protein n=1 Tax=Ceratobasidium theobromae TaxID=1582974 RepID=A0A5N5QN07_9AGAM|nr:Zf-AN1 domain-containing protein [Ceratobasidium theobromae]
MATRKDSTDAQMLFVGSACSLSGCSQHDFLPIRCNLCSETFCSDHFRPDEHKCTKFDPSKADRIAPTCPLCNVPVSIPPGQDPNLKMDTHIMRECSATGNKSSGSRPRCASSKCNKVLIAPIRCNSCRKDFCPEHRFPQQHSCAAHSTSSVSKSTPSSITQSSSKLTDKLPNVSIGQSAPSAAAAIAAIRRTAKSATTATTIPAASASTSAPAPAPASASASSRKPVAPSPFNKTDRCDPNLPSSTSADVALTTNQRPALIDASYQPPPIFGFA